MERGPIRRAIAAAVCVSRERIGACRRSHSAPYASSRHRQPIPLRWALPRTPLMSQLAVTGGKLHGHVKSGAIPSAGRYRYRSEHAHGQTLFNHDGLDRRVVPDDSAERAVCNSHTICGVCAGGAGGGAEYLTSRAGGGLSTDACIARGPAAATRGRADWAGSAGDPAVGE